MNRSKIKLLIYIHSICAITNDLTNALQLLNHILAWVGGVNLKTNPNKAGDVRNLK